MKNILKKIDKNKRDHWNTKGGVMVFVVIIFLIVSILAASVAAIFSANLNQTKRQQDSMEAYYLAYSGALIAHEALLSNNSQKLRDLIAGNAPLTVERQPMGRGVVSVTAEVSTEANLQGWIKITSTSVLVKNNLTNVRILYFDPANPLEMLWSSN